MAIAAIVVVVVARRTLTREDQTMSAHTGDPTCVEAANNTETTADTTDMASPLICRYRAWTYALPSLSRSSASATTSFLNPDTLTDSLGLCAFEIGSSGPVTNTCASGKIFCSSGMNGMEPPAPLFTGSMPKAS